MRFTSFLFFLIMAVALAGCNKGGAAVDAEEMEAGFDYSFENNGQEFEIVHVYQLFDPYFEEAKGLKGEEAAAVYTSSIVDEVADKCYRGGEFEHKTDYLNNPPKNRIAVQDNLKRMDTGDINKAIKDALIKSSNELPAEGPTTVCVFPTDNNAPAQMITAGAGQIVVLYDRNFTSNILKAGVAHEYHHSVWAEKHYAGESFTVLDDLVFEGKATMFQKLIYPNIELTAVDESFNSNHWSKVQGDLAAEDMKKSQEILNGGKNGLPKFYGYSEGYKMVKSYVDANEGISVEDWTAVPASEIFEDGNYEANYN
jgi:hypothetical protein